MGSSICTMEYFHRLYFCSNTLLLLRTDNHQQLHQEFWYQFQTNLWYRNGPQPCYSRIEREGQSLQSDFCKSYTQCHQKHIHGLSTCQHLKSLPHSCLLYIDYPQFLDCSIDIVAQDLKDHEKLKFTILILNL